MKIAFVNLTGGGVSGGGKKTLTKLLPLLKSLYKNNLVVFTHPMHLRMLTLVKREETKSWAKFDKYIGFLNLRANLIKEKADIIFVPNSIHIKCKNIPTVIMVRNMESLTKPFKGNKLNACIKNLLRKTITKISCKKATKIIAVSNYVKDFLINIWDIPEKKVSVVYHGIENKNNLRVQMPSKIKQMNISLFVFTAGSFVSYRGYEDIINAFSRSQFLNNYLVIAGNSIGNDNKYKNYILKLIDKHKLRSKVIFLGDLSQSEMNWCYRNCTVFCMTSRIEACPNIVLEALANGCISISVHSGPMPELFGDVAQYYSAGNIDELSKLILNNLKLDVKQREKIKQIAIERSKFYSWENSVKNLDIVFKEVYENSFNK